MGIFKVRKNKKFSYTPRHYEGDGNPFEIKHKFDEFRKTADSGGGIKRKFNDAMDDYKHNQDESANRRVLIIIGVLLVLFLIFIEFDLSIFFNR